MGAKWMVTAVALSQERAYMSIPMNKFCNTTTGVTTTGSSCLYLIPALNCAFIVLEADATVALPPGTTAYESSRVYCEAVQQGC